MYVRNVPPGTKASRRLQFFPKRGGLCGISEKKVACFCSLVPSTAPPVYNNFRNPIYKQMNLDTLVKSGPESRYEYTTRNNRFIKDVSNIIDHIEEILREIGPAGIKEAPGRRSEFNVNKIVTGDVTDVTFKSPETDFLLFLVRVKPGDDGVSLYASDGSVGEDGKFKFQWYTRKQLVDAAAPGAGGGAAAPGAGGGAAASGAGGGAAAPGAGGGAAAPKRKRKSRRTNRKRVTRRRRM